MNETAPKNEAYLEYLARCARDGEFSPPTTLLAREIYIGPRFAACWLPEGFAAFSAYKGGLGWLFLQVWRLRVGVRWACD